jgi:hypothetical protein
LAAKPNVLAAKAIDKSSVKYKGLRLEWLLKTCRPKMAHAKSGNSSSIVTTLTLRGRWRGFGRRAVRMAVRFCLDLIAGLLQQFSAFFHRVLRILADLSGFDVDARSIRTLAERNPSDERQYYYDCNKNK